MLDRLLGVFGDVREGEGRDCLLLFSNIFVLLVAYYILKTVREPLVLASGAAVKTYASALQAAALVVYVPAYGWLARRLTSRQLVITVLLFFIGCIQLFFFAGLAGMPYLGVIFYVWVGIFSLTCVAQFWSFTNDTYEKAEGDRLFPVIAIGATCGAPLGAAIAGWLFGAGANIWVMMQIAAVLLLGHLALYSTVHSHKNRRDDKGAAAGGSTGGFALVLRSPYLRLIALLLVLLNIVNTTGEYILSSLVTAEGAARAAIDPGINRDAFIGQFYGDYFFWVNVTSVIFQALLVSRVARKTGISGVVLALPIVALGAYGLAAASAGLLLVQVVKTAENGADYSFMNTAKQMLWLPTSRDEKYKGKQAIDTFFVRFGDMMAAAVVFLGTEWLSLPVNGFAVTNLVFVVLSIGVAVLLLREYRRLTASRPGEIAA